MEQLHGRRRARVLSVLVAVLGAMTLTATAGAEAVQASTGADRAAVTAAAPAATCHYRVSHGGGIRIYKQPSVGPIWGSLSDGATFYATCDNLNSQSYSDCPGGTSTLWKRVNAGGGHTGYVKTKCLVRS